MSIALTYRPEAFQRHYIDSADRLRELVGQLECADAIGVDLEMGQRMLRRPGGVQEWKHILALLQIATDDLSVVVDPLRCTDLSPLRGLMSGPVRKVFLGGGQDVALLEQAGIPPRHVVDVGEAAYAVFGRREDGMAALSKRIFGLSLDKTVRRTDWMVRPLNPALIAYAHQDAELTLLIYRWFQQHHPEILTLHERVELEPHIPGVVPSWLRDALLRSASDPLLVVTEYSLDPERDEAQLSQDIRSALQIFASAPRRLNRLLRIAGDLGLRALLPDVAPFADSRSSLLRASAARSIGKLGDAEQCAEVLRRLQEDPIEDVRKAASAALRDVKANKKEKSPLPQDSPQEETPALGGDALAALQRLMQELGGESG